MSIEVIKEFENKVSEYFGSPYGIAIDSCTHGLELCLRLFDIPIIEVPKRTYLSVPMLANKLNEPLRWRNENWKDYYEISNSGIYDAAVLWGENTYVEGTYMCISFQFQKHLSLGRGGMILTDNKEARNQLKKMSYDGRTPDLPWREQEIDTMGYHYYMTPETAMLGFDMLESAKNTKPRDWVISDWPDLTKLKVFNV